MSHVKSQLWHGYATEPRRVEVTITSGHDADDIESAELRVAGIDPIAMAVQSVPGGYQLVADPVVLPANAAVYPWSVEVTHNATGGPIVVAVGSLRVSARVEVAA